MNRPPGSPFKLITGNLFSSLCLYGWGAPMNTLLHEWPINHGTDEERATTIPGRPPCLVLGDQGRVHSFVVNGCGVHALLIRAELVDVLQCIIKRMSGDYELHPTIPDGDLPTTFENPFLNELPKLPVGYHGVSLVGAAQSGKTLLLLTILILRMSARVPTVWMSPEQGILMFNAGDTYELAPNTEPHKVVSLLPPSTWVLVDGPLKANDLVAKLGRFIVQVSPLESGYRDWMRRLRSIEHFIKPWTIAELCACREVQSQGTATERQIEDYCLKYSPSPVSAYAWGPEAEAIQESRIEYALNGAFKDIAELEHAVRTLLTRHEMPDELQPLFRIGPGQYRHQLGVSLATKHIWDKLSPGTPFSLKPIPPWRKSLDIDATYRVFIKDPRTHPAARSFLADNFTARLAGWQYAGSLRFVHLLPTEEAVPENFIGLIKPPIESLQPASYDLSGGAEVKGYNSDSVTSLHELVNSHTQDLLKTLDASFWHARHVIKQTLYIPTGLRQPSSDLFVVRSAFFAGRSSYNIKDVAWNHQIIILQTAMQTRHTANTIVLESLVQLEKFQSLSFVLLTLPSVEVELLFPVQLKDKVQNFSFLALD